jgi:hypothetical protein
MLEDDASKKRIPHSTNRIVIASATTLLLKRLHQFFVRQSSQDELQTRQISKSLNFFPPKQ